MTAPAVQEAVCAERWRQANARPGRIEAVLAAIALLLRVGEERSRWRSVWRAGRRQPL
jgi:hypothetical protein